MVAALMAELVAVVTGFMTVLAAVFEGSGGLFYDAVDGITVLGGFTLLSIGGTLGWMGIRFIGSLIGKLAGRK